MTGPRPWGSPASRSTATSSPLPEGPVEVVRTRADLRAALASAPRPVGLVPTMGWLHAGHTALIERARADNATVVVSIFVNPRQFGETSDFTQYPRNEARDLAVCEAAGVDLVFAPTVDEVYPPGFDSTVTMGAIARPLEGAARPGSLRRRGDRGRDPVRAGRRRAGLLRAQGLPAGAGDPADGAGPRAADRGRRPGRRSARPTGSRCRRATHGCRRLVVQRRRSSAGRCSRARRAWARASVTPTPSER